MFAISICPNWPCRPPRTRRSSIASNAFLASSATIALTRSPRIAHCCFNCSKPASESRSCLPSTGQSFVHCTHWGWSPCLVGGVCRCCGRRSTKVDSTSHKVASNVRCWLNSSVSCRPASGSSFWPTAASAKPIWPGIVSSWGSITSYGSNRTCKFAVLNMSVC